MRATESLTPEDRARLSAAADWMVRLQADDVSEDQLGEWLVWYDEPANRVAFHEMEQVQQEVLAIDPATRATFAHQFSPVETKRSTFRGLRLSSSRWAAAAILVLVAVGVGVQSKWLATEGINTAFRTGRAEHRELHLPDRSIVKLGAQSSLSMNFTREARYLVLEGGEALFEVAHDSARPFVVQAGSVRIKAVGTQFDVRRAEESTFVAVKEGVVEVTQERMSPKSNSADVGGSSPSPEVTRVAAGERAMAARAESTLKLSAIAPQMVATWQEGRLEFVDESLRTVIATVNRYSTREIILTEPVGLGELRFTGIVREGRVDEWINAIKEVFPIEVTSVGKTTVLISPARE